MTNDDDSGGGGGGEVTIHITRGSVTMVDLAWIQQTWSHTCGSDLVQPDLL